MIRKLDEARKLVRWEYRTKEEQDLLKESIKHGKQQTLSHDGVWVKCSTGFDGHSDTAIYWTDYVRPIEYTELRREDVARLIRIPEGLEGKVGGGWCKSRAIAPHQILTYFRHRYPTDQSEPIFKPTMEEEVALIKHWVAHLVRSQEEIKGLLGSLKRS